MPSAERPLISCKACLTVACREFADGSVTMTTYEGEDCVGGPIRACRVLLGETGEAEMLFFSGRMGLLLLYQELIEDGGE